MMDNDYYRQRVEEELAAADSANDAGVSQIHLDMAELYRDLLRAEPAAVNGSNDEPRTVFI